MRRRHQQCVQLIPVRVLRGASSVGAVLALGSLLAAAVAQAQDVSFIARRDFGAGFEPYSVAVGDFNGDEVADLAVANWGFGVSVLINNTPTRSPKVLESPLRGNDPR